MIGHMEIGVSEGDVNTVMTVEKRKLDWPYPSAVGH